MPKVARRRLKARVIPRVTKNNNKEITLLGKALRGLGSLGGSALGSMVGMPVAGAATGNSLGAALSKWLGSGDYSVSKNSLVQKAANGIPMMHNTGQSVVIRHKEFITTIAGSTAFAVPKQLAINPGISTTFPWLSQIARRFQEYEFKGLVFHYVPTSGTFNGSTAALGSVMFQTTYRATDIAPSSKAEMMNEFWANEVVPYESTCHPLECDPKENPFAVHYVRSSAILTGEPLMYDVAKTFVATQGMAGTDIVGDLWVTYEVELKKPLITSAVLSSTEYGAWNFGSVTSSSFFASENTHTGNLAVTFGAKTITIPAGVSSNVYITATIYSVGGLGHATQLSWAAATSTNATNWAYDGASTGMVTTIVGTAPTTTQLSSQFGFTLTDPTLPCVITFPNAQWSSGTTTYCSVVIAYSPQ